MTICWMQLSWLLILLISTLNLIDCENNNVKYEEIQLTKDVIPSEYALSIFIDFNKFQIAESGFAEANLTILIKANRSVDYIIIHCGDNIDLFGIKVLDMLPVKPIKNLYKNFTNLIKQRIKINLLEPLKINQQYQIIFKQFNIFYHMQSVSGIIVKSYESTKLNFTQYMMATQMQPESTRLVFPSFDDPQFKIHFQLNFTTNAEYNILSNMPESYCEIFNTTHEHSWKFCHFPKSLKMSSYNIAFAVVPFYYIEKIDRKHRKFRIWAREPLLKNMEFALNYTVKFFQMVEEELGIDFPLKKIDSLAIPNLRDFMGMEHYGLITYSEFVLNYNVSKPINFAKMISLQTIAHEVAHQWFGNLVTNNHWQDIWLHEGFSTFYSYKLFSSLFENHHIYSSIRLKLIHNIRTREDYYINRMTTIMNPIEISANEKFNFLSYKKGSIIVDFIERLLGKKTLAKAMQQYLKLNSYATVDTNSLWKILNQHSKLNIDKIVIGWLKRLGYPIIKVKPNYFNNELILTQISSINYVMENYNVITKWNIPLFIVLGSDKSLVTIETKLFDNISQNISLNTPLNLTNYWIVLNNNFTAYLAVDYDSDMFRKLTNQFLTNHLNIPQLTRAQIILDFFDISKKFQRNNIHELLHLLCYLRNETDSIPITTTLDLLDKLNGLIQHRYYFIYWNNYLNYILDPILNHILFEYTSNIESTVDVDTVSQLYYFACKLHHNTCYKLTELILLKWNRRQKLTEFESNLLNIALCQDLNNDVTGAKWLKLMNNTEDFDDSNYIFVKYYALACTKVMWTVDRNIAMIFQFEKSQRASDLKYSYMRNPIFLNKETKTMRPLTAFLLVSSVYQNPYFLQSIYRFRRSFLNGFFSAIIEGSTFPTSNAILEYLFPTFSHYMFMRDLYPRENAIDSRVFNHAKINLDWININENNLSRYLMKNFS